MDTIDAPGGRPTPERLARFLSPRSIAVVGASPSSAWTMFLHRNLRAGGFEGPIMPVARRAGEIFGVPTVPTVADLPERPDIAVLLTGPASIEGLLAECRDAGIDNAIVLAGGFGEAGEEGKALQQRIVRDAAAADQLFLGPNNLGFINTGAKVAAFAHMTQLPLVPGPVGVASQSGALAIYLVPYMAGRGVGLSTCVTVGNEAMVTAVDAIDHLVADPDTKVIIAYLEQIAHPEHFVAVAERARDAGKPIVVFKPGRAEVSARVAAAHTGALVGDDRVIDAVFRELGIVRVDSIEQLVSTAGMLAEYGGLPGPRVGFVTGSGAMCAVIAERCDRVGLELPQPTVETVAGLYEDGMPADAAVNNPLDLTGITANNPTIAAQANARFAADPNYDVVVSTGMLAGDEATEAMMQASLPSTLEALHRPGTPTVPMSFLATEINGYARDFAARVGYPHVADSYDRGIPALADCVWWGKRRREMQEEERPAPVEPIPVPDGVERWSEVDLADFLIGHGVPMVPLRLATDADEAVALAEEVGYPVVAKVVSPDIAHKSDVGGVVLDLADADQVRAAVENIRRDVARLAPGAQVDGVSIAPMRRADAEVLVGVVRDPHWGLVLAVGLGGVLVEVLDDTALCRLPAGVPQIRRMLESLRGVDVIRGVRGRAGTDLDDLARVVKAIADVAVGLGDRVEEIEINPLLLDGSRIEGADALVRWRSS